MFERFLPPIPKPAVPAPDPNQRFFTCLDLPTERGLRWVLALLSLLTLLGGASAVWPAGQVRVQEMTLDYLARYNRQNIGPDHLLNVLALSDGRAIVVGNLGLALVDLDALPPDGNQPPLFRLSNLNARDIYTLDEHYFYVNLNRGNEGESPGLAVVERVGDELLYRATRDETGVLYEKMCLTPDYLYVAAHSHGLRIYSLADPAGPALAGSLMTGFLDAFAVAVDTLAGRAYVADGGAGLKIVDVSDPTSPVLLGGEDLLTAAGTAEAISVHNGHVYVASGGEGVAFYPNGDPAGRVLYPVSGAAEDLAWTGDYLAVSDFHGVRVFRAEADGSLTEVESETSQRRGSAANMRLCEGVGTTPDGRILCANWNYMDVYQLLPAAASSQADLNASVQRIRFAPDGGQQTATLTNNGAADLVISSVSVAPGFFTCDYSGGILPPGDSVACTIGYPGSVADAAGVVLFESNDPDENPLPIQAFGKTSYLDPGEPAPDFTLPRWSRDGGGTWTQEPFTLSDQQGRIVWLQVYGTW